MPDCAKCGKTTEGYKCEVCGEEAPVHDENHTCGDDHCVPKCSGCGKAETQCDCG